MSSVRIINADVLDGLAQLADASVNCVVTSPPYWGLRDYGTGTWSGGDAECDHLKPAAHGYAPHEKSTLGPKRDGISAENSAHADEAKRQQFRGICEKCGAIRIDKQIGQEASVAEHIEKLVEVFREVRRVLHEDGTLWLNYGDAYAAGGRGNGAEGSKQQTNIGSLLPRKRAAVGGFKQKDLLLMPARLAIALQADGWYLRSEIIWHKPNPMPESVTDRPTSSHEKIFLLTKSKRYFYDADAVREKCVVPTWDDGSRTFGGVNKHGANAIQQRTTGRIADTRKALRKATESRHRSSIPGGQSLMLNPLDGRNLRNVWTMATTPFPEAHFATFPPKLAETCIKAGCPVGGTVLDPFGGAGTTGMVAARLDRNAILIELNRNYAQMAERRIKKEPYAAIAMESA